MSFGPSPSSEARMPPLPIELELRIFKTCYFAHPEIRPTLLLVCRRVFEWLNAIRYYSIELSTETEVERVETWIQTQPPQSIHQNVKALLINFPDDFLYSRIRTVASVCTGVETLGLWLFNTDDYTLLEKDAAEELDQLIYSLLANLSSVKHFSLSDDSHLFQIINSGQQDQRHVDIAFRESLVSIDWGATPELPLNTFPNITYAMVQLSWPFPQDDMNRMEEWLSRPSSKGLILLAENYDGPESTTELALSLGEAHILRNKKVVLLKSPKSWVEEEWKSCVLGDGEDVLSVGKKIVEMGSCKLEDRVFIQLNESY
ncbi:hypothetical protein DL96DRAFT_1585897 [Flagelloscypha sp. PMI_526]|nr:hypothetical protein DL96DRAFT_1585897 [Flagelloscypha sp. PMI_526]